MIFIYFIISERTNLNLSRIKQLGLGIPPSLGPRPSIQKKLTSLWSQFYQYLHHAYCHHFYSQQASKLIMKITCSNLKIKMLEEGMNLFKINKKTLEQHHSRKIFIFNVQRFSHLVWCFSCWLWPGNAHFFITRKQLKAFGMESGKILSVWKGEPYWFLSQTCAYCQIFWV